MIGSPQQLGAVLFDKLGLSKKRRGKTGFSTDARVLQSIRDEHEVIPKIERWRELNQLTKTYLDVAAGAASTPRAASTRRSCRPAPAPAASRRPTRTSRTSRSARRWGARSAAASRPRPGNVLVSADYSQVELRVLAHVADEHVLKEIFIRGEDVHTATAREVFQVARAGHRRRACARRRRWSTTGSSTGSATTGSPTA